MNTNEDLITDLPIIAETTQRGRKIPIGIQVVLDPISHSGTPPIAVGLFIILMGIKLCGFGQGIFLTMSLPWYWNDAGMATVTEVERIHNHIDDQVADRITYIYNDPQGMEHKGIDDTSKKTGFFVVGQRYPILKYEDNWHFTVLADLGLWERHTLLRPCLQLFGLAMSFVICGLFVRFVGHRINRWKRELLQHGDHAVATFSHYEPAPIYCRIFGFKRSVYVFATESGEQCVALFIRRRTKKEEAEVDVLYDVFYDTANPYRSFVLQALGHRKHFWYSSKTDMIMCSRFMSAAGWFMKAVEYALWLIVIGFSIGIMFF